MAARVNVRSDDDQPTNARYDVPLSPVHQRELVLSVLDSPNTMPGYSEWERKNRDIRCIPSRHVALEHFTPYCSTMC